MTWQKALSLPLLGLVRLYQVTISPLLPPSCRYYPSCSAYAVTALERFGPVKGTWLALRRLGRCHPWSAGGVDHVPARRGDVLDHLGRSVPSTTTAPPGEATPAPRHTDLTTGPNRAHEH